MRLVLVHGINNENNTAAEIQRRWVEVLEDAWARQDLARPAELDLTTVYYGDRLAELAAEPPDRVPMGLTPSAPASRIEFELLDAYRRAAGISDAEVVAAAAEADVDLTAVPMAGVRLGWLVGMARAIEKASPGHGRYLVRGFLPQAAAYLQNPGVQTIIKTIVRDQARFDAGPMVIVAHSLGTVVSYELLLEPAQRDRAVRLFCTLGSPLPVGLFRRHVGRRSRMPTPPIAAWFNGGHREDVVTMGELLWREALGFDGVQNTSEIPNDGFDKHSILAYLAAPKVARAIHAALQPSP